MLIPLSFAVAGLSGLSTAQTSVAQMVASAAAKYNVPASLALGIAAHESGFNPSAVNQNRDKDGNPTTKDWGVMQLNDATVKTLGVADPLDPEQNIDAGVGLLAKYLRQYNGDEQKALWAYASGPGAVQSGNMNSIASQFIDYVRSYIPDPSLDIPMSEGLPGSTPTEDSTIAELLAEVTAPTVSLMGFDVPLYAVVLFSALALAGVVASSRRS